MIYYGRERNIMTETEQTAQKASSKKSEASGLGGMMFEMALASFRGWFDTAVHGIRQSIADAVARVVRQAFVLFLSLLGITFLLFGFAKMLSYLFQVPGIGESIVGVIVLAMAFILAAFTKGERG